MKGLIVIDNIPDHCKSCRIVRIKWDRKANIEVCECPLKEYEYIGYDDKKPSWCPLKPMPKKMKHEDEIDYEYGYIDGRNELIDEILGETE